MVLHVPTAGLENITTEVRANLLKLKLINHLATQKRSKVRFREKNGACSLLSRASMVLLKEHYI